MVKLVGDSPKPVDPPTVSIQDPFLAQYSCAERGIFVRDLRVLS